MGCTNHPNAPASATCTKCKSELCGICTKYLDSGEYCENCASVVEADAYLKSREGHQEELQMEMAQTTTHRITEEEERIKSRNKDGVYVKGGAFMGVMMIVASLSLYAFPDMMKSDEQLLEEQSVTSLVACQEVFQAIGIMLSEGRIPETTMSCPGTNIPNIILRQGDKVTVSHPNPRQFGLDEFYVTSDSHRVVMVGQGQG